MNKLILGALALGTASPAFAGEADEWLGLDREISTLNTAVTTQGGGVDVGALIRSSYAQVDDELAGLTAPDDPDFGGWVFQDVDVWLEGEVGDFDWRVHVDFSGIQEDADGLDALVSLAEFSDPGMAKGFSSDFIASIAAGSSYSNTGGGAALQDAWGDWEFADNFQLRWGQFKFPTTLSTQVDPNRQALINRSVIGAAFDSWDLGAMVYGDYSDAEGSGFAWWLGIQNGIDGTFDEYRFSGRAEYRQDMGGNTFENRQEGGLGIANNGWVVGAAYVSDDGNETFFGPGYGLTVFAIDAAINWNGWGGHLEFANMDFDTLGGTSSGADGTPWSVMISYLLTADLEAAVRYQSTDDFLADLTILTFGISWFLSGHDAKWMLNFSNIESDLNSLSTFDGSIIELGLSLGNSRG